MTFLQIIKPLWIGVALAAGMYELTVQDKLILFAEDQLGTTETKANRGSKIDEWNNALGLPLGSSYCASFVSFALDSANAQIPAVRSGVAQKYITNRSITSGRVSTGRTIPAGSLVIWKRGDTWMGHVGIVVEDWKGGSGKTIEANTSPSNSGSQSNGDGVYRKNRKLSPTSYFRITHFTEVK